MTDAVSQYTTDTANMAAQAVVMLLPSSTIPGLAVSPDDPDATPLPMGAVSVTGGATAANQDEQTTLLQTVSNQQATLINGRAKAEPLGLAGGTPRQLAITTTSASVALTSTVRRISITARGSDMRYVIQAGSAPTAVAGTSHWIWERERLDFAISASSYIAAIIATGSAATTGTLEITELTEPA